VLHIDVRFASSLKQHLHIASLGHIDVRFASWLKQQLHIASLGHIDVRFASSKQYVSVVLVS
jgi:hypothetical protein